MQLGQLRRVNVHGGFVRLAGKILRRVAGDGEVEADADGQQQVAILQGEVGAARRHRAGPANKGRLVAGHHIRGAPGGDGGNLQERAKLLELSGGARQTDAVAGKEQRPLGLIQLFDQQADLLLQIRIAGMLLQLRRIKAAQCRGVVDGRGLHIERNINPDRAGTAVEGEINGLLHVVADLLRIENSNRVLGNRLDDGDDVHLLHAELAHSQRPLVFAEHAVGALHLAGDKQRRRRVQPRASDAGDRVGAARAGGDHADAEMAGDFGISLGADGAGLLMRVADRLQLHFRAERLVQVHGSAAHHQKNVLHALFGNKAHNIIG